MTLTREAKWGWEIVEKNGMTVPARVICWDRKSTEGPCIVALADHGAGEIVSLFRSNGEGSFQSLRDAPAPKASGEHIINVWRHRDGMIELVCHATKEAADKDASNTHDGRFTLLARQRFSWTEGMGLEAVEREGK